MDLQLIIKLKSSYEEWHQTFVNHVDVRSKICNENKTLVAKANESTALVTIFDVDMAGMGAMMADPDFQKMNEPLVEEISPYSITPLKP
ncbi:MAG: hypothetical protein O3A15_03190 [Proteobacteria bacterium]|jgi:hypothetical protein|nr:hypothetical protein [Pseudomonadota bacterium]